MEISGGAEQQIRASFTKEEYDKFLEFFKTVWKSDAPYKVFMARRAFNLNFAFMEIMNAKYNNEYETENIMSQNALLLCAKELASYYQIKGVFPRILIVDDLLVHGRSIMKLIDCLEKLIVWFLSNKMYFQDTRETVHDSLLRSISIYIFAQNIGSVLIDQRYLFAAEMQLRPKELKALSQKISRAVQRCGGANTSYVISAELPWNFYQANAKDEDSSNTRYLFRYRGNNIRFYYRNHSNRVLETVRIHYSDKNYLPRPMCTSLVIFGDIDCPEDNGGFNALCNEVAEEIRSIAPCGKIADILSYSHREFARPKAQMLSFLLSVLSYASFVYEEVSPNAGFIYQALLHSDYQKIASNFGRPAKIGYEVTQLISYISNDIGQKPGLFERVLEKLENLAQPLTKEKKAREESFALVSKWQRGSYNRLLQRKGELHEYAEDIFYEVGLNSECSAYQHVKSNLPFEPDDPTNDCIRFDQYLSLMRECNIEKVSATGCLLNLMDSGLLAMNLSFDEEKHVVQCVLKAGELATFALPRRFSVLIPALATVEKECTKRGVDPKSVLRSFIDYLRDYCYQQDGVPSPEDDELLRQLRSSRYSLLYMYNAGQTFEDWSFNLLTDEDRLSHGIDESGKFNYGKYISWIANEPKRTLHYSACAKRFMDEYWPKERMTFA